MNSVDGRCYLQGWERDWGHRSRLDNHHKKPQQAWETTPQCAGALREGSEGTRKEDRELEEPGKRGHFIK
jgi:hypothetical protein